MGKATAVPVTPGVVEWAVSQSGMSETEIARKVKVLPSTLRAWQEGGKQPILTEARRLASVLHRPFAFFLLPRPPETRMAPIQFRHPANSPRDLLNALEQTHIREAGRLQRLLSWLLSQTNAAVPDLPKPRSDESPGSAAAKTRTALGVDSETQADWPSASEAFAEWRRLVQDHGVFVFLFRMGKDSIHGFSLWDERAPVIAINTWWRVEARTFTLMHEYGHLLTRTSSACIEDGVRRKRGGDGDPIERWCERFAAAVLIPKTDLFAFLTTRPFWNGKSVTSLDDAAEIAEHFKVSLRASVLRLIEENAAIWDLYRAIPPASDQKIPRRGGRGQTRAELRAARYGPVVLRVLREAIRRDLMSHDDALSYLNVSESEFDALTAGRR